ncbi:Integrator complex subunit 3 [Cichlidogyrus casuarinus]|uniref:Integrator complex subunit 3 n=1 Tax=Cichlidogyrus casuarinus TaxID=1844966 RepID=A0ABD2PMT3_9PLAT
MNVEPAILAIMNHLSQRSQRIALSLTEFLVKISGEYVPQISAQVVASIRAGLMDMIRVGVIKSIAPLVEVLNKTDIQLARRFLDLIGSNEGPPRVPTPPLNRADPRLAKAGVQNTIRALGPKPNEQTATKSPISSIKSSEPPSPVGSLGRSAPLSSEFTSVTNISPAPSPDSILNTSTLATNLSSERLLSDEDLNELKNAPMQAKVLSSKTG